MASKKRIDPQTFMQTVPMRNPAARLTENPDGTYTAEVKLVYRGMKRLLAKALGARATKQYALDRIGSKVLADIDGSRSFGSLVDCFATDHKLSHFEARALLMQYIQNLMSSGIVVVGVPAAEIEGFEVQV